MPIFTTALLISIAVAVVSTVAMRVISSLLTPQQSSFGGALQATPQVRDTGTTLTLRRAADPQQYVIGRRRVQGNIVFAHVTDNNYMLHLIVVWAGHEVAGYDDLYFNDEVVPLVGHAAFGKYADFVGCIDYTGGADQVADTTLINSAPGYWTANHRGRGIAYSYLRLRWNRDVYANGLPNIWRVVRGALVHDPRHDTFGYSDNAALAVAAWLNNAKFGRGIPYSDMDLDALSAAANACDERTGDEARYTANGVLSSDTPFVDNLEKLLSAMHGECFLVGGQWVIKAAAWEEPTLAFDEGDFRAAFQVQAGLGSAEAFNAVKGKFFNPFKLWQEDDFPAVQSSVYLAQDGGGEPDFKDIRLELTYSAMMCQRVARIDLRQARQPLSFTAPLKLKGLRARAGDTVAVTNSFLGWSAKPWRVQKVTMVLGFAPGQEGGQQGVIGVDLELRETAEEIYEANSVFDEIPTDPAPNTNLPNVFNPLPASNLRVVESKYITLDGGGVKAKATVTWDASSDAFVQSGGCYQLDYKLLAAVAWTRLPTTTDTTVDILDVARGVYTFRVYALNFRGTASPPILLTQSIAGLSDIPAAPTGFTVAAMGNTMAFAQLDLSPDLDVREGGALVIRHSALLSGATWADGTSLGNPLPGNTSHAWLPLKSGTYMAAFVDSTGQWSAIASFVQTQSSVLAFTTLGGGTLIEDPAFDGVKTGVFPDGGELLLVGNGDFDSVPDVDALLSWDYQDGVVAAGYYDWSAPLDLGAVVHCRLTVSIASQVRDVFDDFDSRSGEVDDWPSWDGAVSGNEADAVTYVRTTPDNPFGSPVWSAWQRIDSAEFQPRGFQLRTYLMSTDPAYNIGVRGLSALIEGVA